MFGFFNEKSTAQTSVQIINCVALGLAAYQMFTNPETQWEEGAEVALLAFNLFCFRRNDNDAERVLNISFNFTSLGVIYAALASGATGRPLTANMASAALHAVNVLTSTCWDRAEDIKAPSLAAQQ